MTPSRTWWQTGVVYQVYPRSFQDTTGNGVGDLPGITRRLDYLASTLGVDAVWISPFYPSPMADFGYDVADYCGVDPMFGTLGDFDSLLTEAHRLGLRLILDWVPNHTSDHHPWFVASRSSRQDPRRDWYVWRDPKPDGSPPNNWLSVFGGPAWSLDDATGQYYLHSFLPEQPDLNWRNPAVRAAMFDTVRFWLDRGVDGIRIDVAHYVMKDPGLRDNPPAPADTARAFKDMGEYESQVHLYDKGHPDVHEVFRDLRRLLDSYEGDRFAVGEIHEFDWDAWAAYYGDRLDELHMPYNFSLVWAPWHADEIRRRVDAMEAALPPGAWPNYVLGNHDEDRLIHRFGAGSARAAAVLLLTLRGTPTIYYGDEIGIPQSDIPPELQQDPWGRNVPGLGRDGCRTPMQWNGSEHAGFSPPGTPSTWLPVAAGYETCNVEAQLADPGSLLNLYRDLLRLRREQPALHAGDYRPLDDVPEGGCFAYYREAEGDRLLVAIDFGEGSSFDLPSGEMATPLLSTHDQPRGGTRIELRPEEALVAEIG